MEGVPVTAAEKLVEKARSKFIELVKSELMKKYPEASEEDIQELIDQYNSVNKEPI